jgi:hypothetical protein
VDEIVDSLKRYGQEKVRRFQAWVEMFEGDEGSFRELQLASRSHFHG